MRGAPRGPPAGVPRPPRRGAPRRGGRAGPPGGGGEGPGVVEWARGESYGGVGTFRDLEDLSGRLGKGEVGVLFLSRTNPVFSLPKAYSFRENLGKAKLSVGMGDLLDETMPEANLVLPLSHSLESWGDAEPRRGG